MIFLAKKLINRLINPYANLSYSQEGEDLILSRVFRGKRRGCYIDVGAYHPKRFSNTFLFYQRGWTGINIDARPESMSAFKKYRRRDINIEAAISISGGARTYYMFSEPAFNTFDEEIAQNRIRRGIKLLSTATIPSSPLSQVLNTHLPENTTIDFMSIDVEGFDLEVLQSNDWERFRPRFVLAECLDTNIKDFGNDPVCEFMDSVRYTPFAKAANTWIFESCPSDRER